VSDQRELILDAALGLMSTQGVPGTSMRQLAAACDVQVAAIYHYFPSKDALLRSVFEERRYSARLELSVPVDPDGTVRERLQRIFEVFWAGALEEEPVLRLLLGEGVRNEPVARTMGESLLEVFQLGVRALLDEHVPELDDPQLVTELIIASVFSAFVHHLFVPDADVVELGRHHGQLVCGALSARGAI
jgi:AcrR family transcriptional regulator